MENEQDMLYDMNIEKAKALFEYEMTSVLLAEKEADEKAKERIRQYMEMEIDKPELSYTAPEVGSVEVDLKLGAEPAAMPDFSIPQITAEADGLPAVAKTQAFVPPTFSEQAEIRDEIRVPGPALDASGGFPAEELFSFSKKTEAEPLKNEDLLDLEMLGAGLKGARIQADMKALSDLAADISLSGPAAGIPERMNTKVVFSTGEIKPPEADIGLPSVAETSFVFEPVQTEVSLGEISVPDNKTMPEFIPATGFAREKTLPKETAEITVPDFRNTEFELSPVKKAEFFVDYKPAVPVDFEFVKPVEKKINVPEYPDVPEAPDISAYVDDIMETLRSDLA